MYKYTHSTIMQIKSNQMNHFEEVVGTFRLINYFLKIFALDCNLKGKDGLNCWTFVRIMTPLVVLGSFNLSTLIYKLMFLSDTMVPSVRNMDAAQMVYDLLQYMVDKLYVYKYGSAVCLEYVNRYCYMDSLLGMKYYTDIKRIFTQFFIPLILLWLITCVYDFVVWNLGYGLLTTMCFSSSYIHLFIKILTSSYLSLQMMHIESRLRTIGDWVQTLYVSSGSLVPTNYEALSSTWFCPYSKKCVSTGDRYSNAKINVKWFKSYYLLLSEQVKFINSMFGMRILLNSLSLLIDMVRFINLAVRIFMGSQYTGTTFYPAVGTIAKLISCIVVLFVMVYRSERAYEQRSRLLCLIDNLLVNKKIDESLVDDIKDFHDLVLDRPISFSMAHYVRIDNTFLVSTASVVTTYSIILLQN